MKKHLLCFASLIAAMTLSVNVDAELRPNPSAGKRLFLSYCMVCHGPEGKGNGNLARKLGLRPADLTDGRFRWKNVKEISAVIGWYGRQEGSKMPAWGTVLPKKDLHNIAAFITQLNWADIKYTGDRRSGRVIFKSVCAACHGAFGSGDGVLANLIDIPMVDYTDAESIGKYEDEEIIKIIREGKGSYMPAWKGTFGDDEIVDIAAYVRMLPTIASAREVAKQQIVPDILNGKHLYRGYCLVCHGIEGKGKGPLAEKLGLESSDLTTEKYQDKDIEKLADLIAGYGRKQDSKTPIWAKRLSRQEIYDVAAYLPQFLRKDLEYSGDARRGRSVFKGACVACHGRFGTGKGILAQLIGIPMINFTDPAKMGKIGDSALLNSIREGKGAFMPSWKGDFTDREINDVASYIRKLAR